MHTYTLTPLSLLICSTCSGTGRVRSRRCHTCHGVGSCRTAQGHILYWHYPLERILLTTEKIRRRWNTVRFFSALILAATLFVWTAATIYLTVSALQRPLQFSDFTMATRLLFLSGVTVFGYVWYRALVEKKQPSVVEHVVYGANGDVSAEQPTWGVVLKTSSRYRYNIADTFTDEALGAVGKAFLLASDYRAVTLDSMHLFLALLQSNRIGNTFIRLGISTDSLSKSLIDIFSQAAKDSAAAFAPQVGEDMYQIFFQAYDLAEHAHQTYVSVTELLLATVSASPQLQEMLFDLGIDATKLKNVVEWTRIRERLSREYTKVAIAGRHRSKYGMDRAMTALSTPYLNQFSEDMTRAAQLGRTEPCVARDAEIDEVFQVIEGGVHNVLLVGDYGVGKRSIVEGIAERMISGDVPKRLNDKRLVRLSISSLLSGTTPSGAIERLITIVNEIARARNIILFIHNLHELMGISTGQNDSSLDIASAVEEYLASGSFLTIATTTTESFEKVITNSKLSTVFSRVTVKEMDDNQAVQVLESKAGYVEYKEKVFFAYDALAKAVEYAKRFLRETALPGSALEVMSEAAVYTRAHKGIDSLVTVEEVGAVIAEKTHIPVTAVSDDEGSKLLHLEEEMHKRVIGQDEAVQLVASALRRARAAVRSQTKPIANFLFLGPTGVGKTELAKTIAQVYFGGEQRMTRLDMSEYQDKSSVYRLIGAPGEKGSGLLTEAVRRQPFGLLLLDEIEKADKDILNLFLQVMDDGRLTDSTGRVVDFTNTIIIATSNAGTSYVQEQMRAGLASNLIKDRLLHGELKQYFKPEFLNRFDGIVLFEPLSSEAIKKIAALVLKRIALDLEEKGITLTVQDEALDYFAKIGFDPEFGARPLRRVLQEKVENQLADLLLGGKLKRRDKVIIGAEGLVTVA